MNSHQVKNGRVAVASATVTHVFGWAAFLRIVLRPLYIKKLRSPSSMDIGPCLRFSFPWS